VCENTDGSAWCAACGAHRQHGGYWLVPGLVQCVREQRAQTKATRTAIHEARKLARSAHAAR
jgi:hypothetical protein